VDTCWERRGSFSERATLAFVQAYAVIGQRSAEAVPVVEMAVFEEVLSSSLSDRKDLPGEEAAGVGSVYQRCFSSSQQHGLVEPEHVEEAQLVEQPHPIVAQVARLRRSDKLVDGRLGVLEHCVG
jgi:hypothetical protein